MFQQDNARPHVPRNVLTLLDTEHVRLWPARSADLSPIENVCSMAAKRLAHHHSPITAVDEQWHSDDAAWTAVPVYDTQFLFDFMPLKFLLLMSAVAYPRTDFSGSIPSNFMEI